MFALLKKKTKQTYIRLLSWIKFKYREFMNFDENMDEIWLEPPGAICDFELSYVNAFETVFPNVHIGLCSVHLQSGCRTQTLF